MFIVLMGVSGSGKTTIGKLLAARLHCPFYDGDDFHPPANITKMAAGIPLTDQDRSGWLQALADLIRGALGRGESGVLACSALKARYRQVLNVDSGKVKFIYLKGGYNIIQARMQARQGHYMLPAMLHSQFEALEEPSGVLTEDVTLPPEEIVQNIMEQIMETKYTIGVLGLGVMGRGLALNIARHDYPVIGYNRHPDKLKGFPLKVTGSIEELVGALESPRAVLMLIPAGKPVDDNIASLKPYLQPGDMIIDGGNSFFEDTQRRTKELGQDGLLFIGMGVSGGESGALWGPSMMPGGAVEAWERVRPILESIAARAEDGQPCVAWMGPDGAGHYVKMVHNGIEYGDMQLIAEVYDLLHRGASISNLELADIFAEWNQGELRSYLIEITAEILKRQDKDSGQLIVDLILDEAAQKGTGKWTGESALDIGVAIPTINAAVDSRFLSALKPQRTAAARVLGSSQKFTGDKKRLIAAAGKALYASKITSYAQGINLLRAASSEYAWDLDISQIVRIWRAGCIIRAALLNDIAAAYQRDSDLENLLLDEAFKSAVLSRQDAWREVLQTAVGLGIPMLATSASLAYFDAYRSERLPANLTQAQRDYFGAHTYRRIDKEGVFHTDWETPDA
jgi:6-phosphogluconate dehydrogenase